MIQIPKIGLGTWLVPDNEAAATVRTAIECGYRHIDTAQAYENEAGVGEGVRSCGIPREQIFITSKVAAEIKNYKDAAASVDASLQRLGLGYIDLMLIHCPQPWDEFRGPKRYFKENREVWKALEEALDAGKVKAIGVSNFLEDDLCNILDDCTVRPAANQFEIHVGNAPAGLIEFCRREGVVVEAYSPIAHGRALNDTRLKEIAGKYGVSTAQLCIRYTLQLGAVSLPKSTDPEHIKSNLDVNFEISEGDMDILKTF